MINNNLYMDMEYVFENNAYVDVTNYKPFAKQTLPIPEEVLEYERYVFPSRFPEYYRQGIYLLNNEEIYLNKDIDLQTDDGTKVNINTLEQLDKIWNKTSRLYIKDTNKIFLTKLEYDNIKYMLTDTCRFPLLTYEFIKFVETYIMTKINYERGIVLKGDVTDVDVSLISPLYTDIHSVEDFFREFGFTYDNHLITSYTILMDMLLNLYQNFNPLSVKYDIKNDTIYISYFNQPSSRRYLINYMEKNNAKFE